MCREISYDDYEFSTRSLSEMWAELAKNHQETEWKMFPRTSRLKAYGFSGDDLEKHDTRVQRLLGSVDPDLARDTASAGTQLLLTLGKDVYLVRKCAMPSVYESAMISGKSLGLMDPAARSSTLNHCLHVAQGGSTALIRAGKLSALLSDGYVVMDSMRVYETAERAIRNRMGTPDFRSGRITHSYSDMLLELPDIQDKFLKEYRDALTDAGTHYRAPNVMPAVRISTSDTGASAATIMPLCKADSPHGSSYLNFCAPIKVEHRSKGTGRSKGIAAFQEETENLFSKFNQTCEVVGRMAGTTIFYPMNFIRRVCERVKLPAKYTIAALEAHQMFGERQCSCYDCYMSIYDGFADVSEPKTRLDLEEKTRKILKLRWRDYDTSVKM